MKFCKDCKHFYEVVGYCARKKMTILYFPPSKYKKLLIAEDERASWLPWHCGKNAKFFEEKE